MADAYVPYEGPVVTRAEALQAGIKRYFNGKACCKGHVSERRTSSKACFACCADNLALKRQKTAEKLAVRPPTSRMAAQALGHKRYWTGKPCSKGHIAERNTGSRSCCACSAEKSKQVPRETKAECSRRWRANNPEKSAEALARYVQKNRAKLRARSRDAYRKNPEADKARSAKWRKKNPEGVRAQAMTRLARAKGAAGSYNHSDIRDLHRMQRSKCAWCRTDIRKVYQVDHIRPLSRGGSNDRSNLQLLCPTCNRQKYAKDPIDWAQENGRLL